MIAAALSRARRFGLRLLTRPRLDLPLMAALLAVIMIGLLTLYSAGERNSALVIGQAMRLALGGVLLVAVSRIPPSVLRSWTPWLYGFSVALLVLVAIIGEGRGTNRWLDLGVVRFQPSELLKLTVPMMAAWYLHPRALPPRWRDLLVIALLIGVPALLIARQPDLGTALLVTAAGLFVLACNGGASAPHWPSPRPPRRWPGISCTTTSASDC